LDSTRATASNPRSASTISTIELGANWLNIVNDGKVVVGQPVHRDERAPERADGGKRFNGLRLCGQTQLNEKPRCLPGSARSSASTSRPMLRSAQATDAVTRDDKQYDANIASTGISTTHDAAAADLYIRNNSNIVIYQFDRTDVSITIRRDFK